MRKAKEGEARVFPYLSAFTRSHVRDPNRCTLSLRLRLGTATTRDNKGKKDARTRDVVCGSGTRFQIRLSLFYLASRVFVSFRRYSRFSSPLCFFSQSRVECSIKSNGPVASITGEKEKKKISRHEKDSWLPSYANFNRSIKSVSKHATTIFSLLRSIFNDGFVK